MSTRRRFDATVVRLATERLQAFTQANTNVQLAVLTSGDGFEVASYPSGRPSTAKVAAMGSSMQALSEALSREAGLSHARNLIIEGDSGSVLVLGLSGTSPQVSLAVVAAGSELLGRLLWASRNLCKELEAELTKTP